GFGPCGSTTSRSDGWMSVPFVYP
ncbi:MAG: hypothetical protein AVDCRST_MAG68-4686, partial [uncultured Gemmatimonadetes bacterium]